MKYGLYLLFSASLVAGVWLAAPERGRVAGAAPDTLAAARAPEEPSPPPLDRCVSELRTRVPALTAAAERRETEGPAPLPSRREDLERERARALDELFAGIDSAAAARFRRGEFELAAGPDSRPTDRIQVVRRSPAGLYERVELTAADHPDLYALRELAQSLLERIDYLEQKASSLGSLPACPQDSR